MLLAVGVAQRKMAWQGLLPSGLLLFQVKFSGWASRFQGFIMFLFYWTQGPICIQAQALYTFFIINISFTFCKKKKKIMPHSKWVNVLKKINKINIYNYIIKGGQPMNNTIYNISAIDFGFIQLCICPSKCSPPFFSLGF